MDPPKGMKTVARVWYDADTDTLVAAEEGVDEQGQTDMRHIGRVFVCKGYQAGNREAVSFTSGAGPEAGCVAAAGDYVFTGGWKERGRVWVNRMSDGAPVGVLDPGPTVGGVENTGWIDVLTGITAHRRKDGEYLSSSRRTTRPRRSSTAGGRENVREDVGLAPAVLGRCLSPSPRPAWEGEQHRSRTIVPVPGPRTSRSSPFFNLPIGRRPEFPHPPRHRVDTPLSLVEDADVAEVAVDHAVDMAACSSARPRRGGGRHSGRPRRGGGRTRR